MKTDIELAREAGVITNSPYLMPHDHVLSGIERFAALVRADEREAAEERVVDLFADMETPYLPDIVNAILARGETK